MIHKGYGHNQLIKSIGLKCEEYIDLASNFQG